MVNNLRTLSNYLTIQNIFVCKARRVGLLKHHVNNNNLLNSLNL